MFYIKRSVLGILTYYISRGKITMMADSFKIKVDQWFIQKGKRYDTKFVKQ